MAPLGVELVMNPLHCTADDRTCRPREMTHEDTVVSCIAEVFNGKGQAPPVLSLHTPLDATLGLDSLDYAELVVRLEGAFGVDPFASGAVPTVLHTVGDLVRLYAPDGSH